MVLCCRSCLRLTGKNVIQVTFMAFEKWWKDRTGIADVSIPVLPEIMVEQVNDAGKLYDRGTSKLDISQTRQRNGKGCCLSRS
eukprot:SAG31_NODE_451_length_15511_cov_77.547301_5_plen_83_part_00